MIHDVRHGVRDRQLDQRVRRGSGAAPFGIGTLRTDTFTFGCLLFGTILIVGALLFLPVAVLGPVAEHLGPIPFGG